MDYKECALDEAAVEEISARVQDYLSAQKMERRSVQRIRLTAEELLLNILSHCGRGVMVSIGLGKQFGRQMLRVCYEGEAFDPVKNSEDPLSDEILRSLGVLPAWSYRGRMNTVSSLAALTLSLETCERKLGVKHSTVAFAYPLGSVIFKSGCIFSFTVFTCFMAQFYHVAVSPAWCLLGLITVTLLVIALPRSRAAACWCSPSCSAPWASPPRPW